MGLAADVCVHGHLCAGTAALECALQNIPTILIDREGEKFSYLSELPKKHVVFKNWDDAINEIMIYFKNENQYKEFGKWNDDYLYYMDPFRDGKSAQRMGTFLKDLLNQYELGESKENALSYSIQKYENIWGKDKVINNI